MTFCCCSLKLLVMSHLCSAGLPSNITVQGSIMINGEKVVRGVEGENITIVCIVESGRPPVETLILSINGSNITNEGSDRIRYSFIPTKLDNMKLFTCSAYSSILMNPLSCEVRLDIQYSPVVAIRRKLTKTKVILICNPSGNPANYTFGDWEHWSEFDEHIRNVQGTSGGTLIMKYTTDNKLDEIDGIYKCKTSNGIFGTNGHLYQKGSILINNKVPPSFVNSNKQIQFGRYGKEMNLTVLVYNKYGTLKTNLLQRNKTLNVNELQKSIDIHEMVHDVNITVACIKIIFQLTLNKIEDCTDYTIEACNKKGCNELMVKIKRGNRPEPPTNMSVIPFERYLTVLWNRGYNGGFPQTFFIEYRQETMEKWRQSDPVIDSMQARMSNILFNLSPQTRYLVRVLSTNVIGESKKTDNTLIITLAINPSGERSQSVQGIVIVVLVLGNIVIGLGIGIFVRFLQQKTKKRMITAANVRASEASNDDSIIYEDIIEDENHQTSSQENENPIVSIVNTIGAEKRYKDTVSSENALVMLVASTNNIEDMDNCDKIYAQPYKSLMVQYRDDDENVNLITKQNSIYENENSLDNSASDISYDEILQDTNSGDEQLRINENADNQTSSQENEHPILSTVNINGVENRDKDTFSSEIVSVLSNNSINDADNNDGIYEQPYASYENETYLDNSASEISSEFLQDTSAREQELLIYENVVEEEVYQNCNVNDIDNDCNCLHIDSEAEYINLEQKK
ncbi:cell adhesion molecule DSCAM-like [Mytilus galloprovincialis]|uniref:cell adhesion molecule DSCAM-like n=1 Tax=Mytilus galloprovincialis TaxID=29158 RepID=UPI003F7BE941